ncbi:MAG: hypothetical protein IKD74_03650 [Clostridia bacterium]|nr:hypothetical protein [Clostridia bacterium]
MERSINEKNVIRKASNVALKARKGYTKFMYKDSTARDEYLGAIDEKIAVNDNALEEAKALREAKKEERLRLKAERLAQREKERNEFAFGFKKRDFEEDTESESKPRRSFFDRFKIVDEEEESNELELILVNQFRDKDLKPYAKELKGRDLLKRDFESTPLYIETHGDFLKVSSAETIESNHAGVVTVVISTYREDFLVDFPMDF